MSTEIQKPQPIAALGLKPKGKNKITNSWALSYSDMVTSLLCFFIIFYALEKQLEKRATNPLKGYQHAEGILMEHKALGNDENFKYAMEILKDIPEIGVKRSSSFVDISFKKTVFFERGLTSITPEGKELLDFMVKRLTLVKGKYLVEIQGHADSTPVKRRNTRWWSNNMELSVQRALSVHSYLAEQYLDKEDLVISGYGSLKKYDEGAENLDEMNRRISMRLHLAK